MIYKISALFKLWGLVDGISVLFRILVNTLFPSLFEKVALEDILIRSIRSNGYEVHSHKDTWVISKEGYFKKVICRKFTSDLSVFKQLLIDNEFADLFKIIEKEKISIETIIDAGGNIGLSSLMFALQYPKAKMLTIEPDGANFEILSQNISNNSINGVPLNKGVWKDSKRLYFDRSFGDGQSWAISLTEDPVSKDFIDAISFNEMVEKYSLETIGLLKIDIEGGERYIFNESNEGLEFLDKTKIIAIEIHKEFNIKDRIVNCLISKNFTISQSGEYLIGWKS